MSVRRMSKTGQRVCHLFALVMNRATLLMQTKQDYSIAPFQIDLWYKKETDVGKEKVQRKG